MTFNVGDKVRITINGDFGDDRWGINTEHTITKKHEIKSYPYPWELDDGLAFGDDEIEAVDAHHDEIERIINGYHNIREQCYRIMCDEPKILGEYAWLEPAIYETDIQISAGETSISCSGTCYTSQTMDHEWFSFEIPLDRIEK